MGLGDLIGSAVSRTIRGSGGFIRETVSEMIGAEVGEKADELLCRVGLQKEVDGSLFLTIPFFKSVESRSLKYLKKHPDWAKMYVHLFADSVKKAAVFYNENGEELYQVNQSRRNLKHMELYKGEILIGKVRRKLSFIRNPVTDPYKFEIVLHNNELGLIEVREQKLVKIYVEPDFDTWTIQEKGLRDYEICDKDEREIASIYSPGEYNYLKLPT